MAAGRLGISSITAEAAPRQNDKPRHNHRPDFENIMRSGTTAESLLQTLQRSGAREEFVKAMTEVVSAAMVNKVEKQTLEDLRTLSGEVRNDIILLYLGRSKRMIEFNGGEMLLKRPELCKEMMKNFPDAADTMPAVLLNLRQTMGSAFYELTNQQIIEIVGKSIAETGGVFCPKVISRTVRKKIKKGDFDNIAAVVKIKAQIQDEPLDNKETETPAAATSGASEPAIVTIIQEPQQSVSSQETGVMASISQESPVARSDSGEIRIVYIAASDLWTDQPKRGIGGDDDSHFQRQLEGARTVRESSGKAERKEARESDEPKPASPDKRAGPEAKVDKPKIREEREEKKPQAPEVQGGLKIEVTALRAEKRNEQTGQLPTHSSRDIKIQELRAHKPPSERLPEHKTGAIKEKRKRIERAQSRPVRNEIGKQRRKAEQKTKRLGRGNEKTGKTPVEAKARKTKMRSNENNAKIENKKKRRSEVQAAEKKPIKQNGIGKVKEKKAEQQKPEIKKKPEVVQKKREMVKTSAIPLQGVKPRKKKAERKARRLLAA